MTHTIKDLEKIVVRTAVLKNTERTFERMDALLFGMLDYLLKTCTMAEQVLLYIITIIAAGGYKGKLTHLNDNDFILRAVNLLKQEHFTVKGIKKLKLTREIVEDIIVNFLEFSKDYELLVNEYIDSYSIDPLHEAVPRLLNEMIRIENSVGGQQATLLGTIRNVREQYTEYKELKDSIIEAYLRKSLKKVAEMSTRKNMDLGDIFQNTIFGLNKAIYLYDHERGNFGSYLDFWIQFTITEPPYQYELGLAYDVPSGVRKRKNIDDEKRKMIADAYGVELDPNLPVEAPPNEISDLDSEVVKDIVGEKIPFDQQLLLGLKYSSTVLLPQKPKGKEIIKELMRQVVVRTRKEDSNHG